ncbi:MAG: hypothetical protein GC181_13945 [Bacteroidetes bacterium]|nr:hypothetical protein [Bacteroidota bacterium]
MKLKTSILLATLFLAFANPLFAQDDDEEETEEKDTVDITFIYDDPTLNQWHASLTIDWIRSQQNTMYPLQLAGRYTTKNKFEILGNFSLDLSKTILKNSLAPDLKEVLPQRKILGFTGAFALRDRTIRVKGDAHIGSKGDTYYYTKYSFNVRRVLAATVSFNTQTLWFHESTGSDASTTSLPVEVLDPKKQIITFDDLYGTQNITTIGFGLKSSGFFAHKFKYATRMNKFKGTKEVTMYYNYGIEVLFPIAHSMHQNSMYRSEDEIRRVDFSTFEIKNISPSKTGYRLYWLALKKSKGMFYKIDAGLFPGLGDTMLSRVYLNIGFGYAFGSLAS